MSENLPQASPYEPIFKSIEIVPDCSTAEAYEMYNVSLKIGSLDPSIYLSMAITSGGYARDGAVSAFEAIKMNGDYVSMVADVISKQYQPHIGLDDIVVPSDLGKVPGWGQADYLLFWAHVITGLDVAEAKKLDAAVQETGVTKLSGFFDKNISREDRWNDYKKLIDIYTDLFQEMGLGKGAAGAELPNNMQAVLLALDAQESLGVNAERYLCHRLGLGEYVCGLVVDENAEVSSATTQMRQLGALTLEFGSLDIAGRVNQRQRDMLRKSGVRFRKSGLLAVIDRKITKKYDSQPTTKQTQAELWAEYYATEL